MKKKIIKYAVSALVILSVLLAMVLTVSAVSFESIDTSDTQTKYDTYKFTKNASTLDKSSGTIIATDLKEIEISLLNVPAYSTLMFFPIYTDGKDKYLGYDESISQYCNYYNSVQSSGTYKSNGFFYSKCTTNDNIKITLDNQFFTASYLDAEAVNNNNGMFAPSLYFNLDKLIYKDDLTVLSAYGIGIMYYGDWLNRNGSITSALANSSLNLYATYLQTYKELKADDYHYIAPVTPSNPTDPDTIQAKFNCFGEYSEYTKSDFVNDVSVGCYKQYTYYDTSMNVNCTDYYYDDMALCKKWQAKTLLYNSESIAFSVYTGDTQGKTIYLSVSQNHYSLKREGDSLLGYFIVRDCNTFYDNITTIQSDSMLSLNSNTTYTYKLNMNGFVGLNLWSAYYVSVRVAGEDTPLTEFVYTYTGKEQSADYTKNKIDMSVQTDDGNTIDTKTNTPNDDGFLSDYDGSVQDNNINSSLDYVGNIPDITDLISSINQSIGATTSFFQFSYQLVPASIITILLLGVSLIVLLRVLGR